MKKQIIMSSAIIAGLVGWSVSALWGATSINSANHYAYGANTGWIDARGDTTNGAVIGQSYCEGYLYSANCGWISLGNGPTNGWHYNNASSSDWGVNHDGEGHLTGYAYGANIGWINFEQTYGKPTVNLLTGNLSGYIWSANTGWISLSNAQAFVQVDSLAPGADSDGDGIPDPWEYQQAGNLTTLSGGNHDADGDGANDADEYGADTDPQNDASVLLITAIDSLGNKTNRVVWTSKATRFYQLQTNSSLTNTTWADSGYGVMAADGATTARTVVNPGTSNMFERVKAIIPLAP